MFNISSYLKKAGNLIDAKNLSQGKIIEVIRTHTSILLETKDFEVKDTALYLRISPIEKNIVFIQKDAILKDLQDIPIREIR